MTFSISVEVNPGQAIGSLADLNKALAGAEVAGDKAGKATTASLDAAASAAQRLRMATLEIGKALASGGGATSQADQLTASLQRQEEVLARMNAPVMAWRSAMQGADADIDALDALLKKNSITFEQHTAEVHRLNVEVAAMKPGGAGGGGGGGVPRLPSIPSPSGGAGGGEDMFASITAHAGPAGAMLQQFANGGTAAVGAMAMLGEKLVSTGDDYIELTNRVQRFATAQHSADSIVNDQLSMAGDLHASLAQTVELYARVRQGTDELGLSYGRSATFTRALGQEVELSGKGLDEASNVMAKFSYWMDSGSITGRELKGVMRDIPALADTWSAAFGKGPAELVKMANEGKLSVTDLELAIESASGTIQDKFGQRVETAGEAWQHLKDQMTVTVGKFTESTGLIPHLTEAIGDLGKSLAEVGPLMGGLGDGLRLVGDLAAADGARLAFLSDTIAGIGQHAGGAARGLAMMFAARGADSADSFTANLLKMEAAALQVKQTLDHLAPENAGAEKIFTDMATGATAAHDKVLALQASIAQLDATQASMVNTGNGALGYAGKSGWGGFEQYDRDVADQRLKLSRELEDATLAETKATMSYGEAAAGAHAKTLEHTRSLEDLKNALAAGAITAKEYQTAMAGLAGAMSAEQKLYESIVGPQRVYNETVQAAGDLFQHNRISAGQYRTELEKLAATKPPDAPQVRDFQLPASYGGGRGFELAAQKHDEYLPTTDSIETTKAGLKAITDGWKAMAEPIEANFAESKKLEESLKALDGPAQKYVADVVAINKEHAMNASYDVAGAMDRLHQKYAVATTDAEKMAREQANVNQLFGVGAIQTFQDYERQLDEIHAKYDHTFGQGVTNGLHAIKEQTLDLATSMKGAMVSAFNGINQSIADLVVDGKADWHKLVNGIEKDAVKISLQVIEGALINSATTTAAMAAGGAVAAGELAATFTLGGLTAGTEIGGGMTIGAIGAGGAIGAAMELAGSIVAEEIGLAMGNPLGFLPGFATGGSFMVGGDGGTDTTPVAFRATRGERVTVETPGQQASRGGGGGPAPVVHVKVIHVHDHEEATLEVMRSRPGEQVVVTHVAKNKRKLGG